MKTREEEAQEWLENEMHATSDAEVAHLAGQRIGERRVIELLKSKEATGLDYAGRPYGIAPEEWADWLEKKLGK